MKHTYFLSLICIFFFLVGCDFFKSEDSKELASLNEKLVQLNNTLKNKKIVLSEKISGEVFKNKKEKSYSIIVYYDANCSVCFSELEKWKEVLKYFETIDEDLNVKFILYSDDINMTDMNLETADFPRSLVVYDKKNDFLLQYPHVITKAYNTMLLNENKEIVLIGSPKISNNLKAHFTRLIKDKY